MLRHLRGRIPVLATDPRAICGAKPGFARAVGAVQRLGVCRARRRSERDRLFAVFPRGLGIQGRAVPAREQAGCRLVLGVAGGDCGVGVYCAEGESGWGE